MKLNRVTNKIRDNFKFILAVSCNSLALALSIWWLIDSNSNIDNGIEFEPIVTTIILFTTLFSLNYVNDKIGKVNLKLKSSVAIFNGETPSNKYMLNIRIENHSIYKTYIKSISIKLTTSSDELHFIYDSSNGGLIGGISLEPGEAKEINIDKNCLQSYPLENYGNLVVRTALGHEYYISSDELNKNAKWVIEN